MVLKNYLFIYEISHYYITTPHTPQQNGVSEHRHRHLVEIGLTFLHDTSLPLTYWPYAFLIATYLINRQPTPILNNKSSFQVILQQKPNYLKLKKWALFVSLS